MHDLSPYNLDRTISIHGAIKQISEAEQLISEKLRQYEVQEVVTTKVFYILFKKKHISQKDFFEIVQTIFLNFCLGCFYFSSSQSFWESKISKKCFACDRAGLLL